MNKISSLAILLLTTQAIQVKPDAFGPEGRGYEASSPTLEMAQVGIDFSIKNNKNKKCENRYWATIHYTGTTQDGTVVSDSRQENQGQPKTFGLGNDQVFKCWDLALLEFHPGDKAVIHCPGHLVYGTKDQVSALGEKVPANSPVDFEIEVLDCNIVPPKAPKNKQPKTTTMKADECMYLHLVQSDNTGLNLVLSAQDELASDKWPGKWAIFEEKVVDDEDQQWYFNAETNSLTNKANPTYHLDMHDGWAYLANNNLTKSESSHADASYPHKVRQWFYDPVGSALTTQHDGITHQLAIWGQPKAREWAEVAPAETLKDNPGAQLHIEYCYLR